MTKRISQVKYLSIDNFSTFIVLHLLTLVVVLGEESAVEALIAQFYHWEGCAKIAEKKTNAILDGEDVPTPKSSEEFIEETVAKRK